MESFHLVTGSSDMGNEYETILSLSHILSSQASRSVSIAAVHCSLCQYGNSSITETLPGHAQTVKFGK